MATITSTIKLVDQMTPTLNKISKAIDRVNAQSKVIGSAKTWNGFNTGVTRATKSAHNLYNSLRRIAFTLATLQGLKGFVEIADTMMNTKARLTNITGDLAKTKHYMDAIYQSAQRSRSNFNDTANSVSKLATLAGHAFDGSMEQVIAFTELMNKLFVISGASAAESSNAMYQLTQAMAAGKLQGDEMRSIMENAPLLAQKIADKLGVSVGEVKELGAEGKITADVIKDALFTSANEIEDKFNDMPKTIGQVWTEIKNSALKTFQPVIDKIQEFLNSPVFEKFKNNLINLITTVANKVIWLFDQFNRPEVQSLLKSLSKPLKVIKKIISEIGAAIERAYEWVLANSSVVTGIVRAIANGLSILWEILKKVGSIVVKVADWFCDNWSKIEPIVTGVVAALGAYYTWILLCKSASIVLSAATSALNFVTWLFTSTLGNVVLVIGLIVAAVFWLVQKYNEATGETKSALGYIVGAIYAVGAFFSNFGEIISGVVQNIKDTFAWLWENIKVLGSRIGEWFSTFGSALSAAFTKIKSNLVLTAVWLGLCISMILDKCKQTAKLIGEAIIGTLKWIGASISWVWDNVSSSTSILCSMIPYYFDMLVAKVKIKFWNMVQGWAESAQSLVESSATGTTGMLKSFIEFGNRVISIFNSIRSGWNSVANALNGSYNIFGKKFEINLPTFGEIKDITVDSVIEASASVVEGLAGKKSQAEADLFWAEAMINDRKNRLSELWNTGTAPKYGDYADWGAIADLWENFKLPPYTVKWDSVGKAWSNAWANADYEDWVPYDVDWKSTFQPLIDAFGKGYDKGKTWQENIAGIIDSVGSFIDSVFNGGTDTSNKVKDKINGDLASDALLDKMQDKHNSDNGIPDSLEDLLGGYDPSGIKDYLDGILDNTGSSAGSVGNIEDTLDLAEEELELLRKLAEQEVINRFTTAEIHVDMTNNNNVSSNMDLDGIVTHLSNKLYEELGVVASGVHY